MPSETKKKIDKYLTKYAGEYLILVDDFNSPLEEEKIVLAADGSCTWQWVSNSRVESTKYGKWSAAEGYINTIVKGNSGDLPEDFTFKNGKFRNGHRYLRKKR